MEFLLKSYQYISCNNISGCDTITYDVSRPDILSEEMHIMNESLIKAYLPMSESAYYILLSLKEPRHGYGIILYVKEITQGRIILGAGTIYGTLTKFEKDKLIIPAGEEERRKLYKLTEAGNLLLEQELKRIDELSNNGHSILGGMNNGQNI